MRFAHSRAVTHCDLKPENILLDWNWSVRIAGFRGSSSAEVQSRYFAPECYDNTFSPARDVFAFALILFEILTGERAFPTELSPYAIGLQVISGDRPRIRDSVLPAVWELITNCWADEPDDRPTFEEIVDQLREMEFKVTANVNFTKLAVFVEEIEEWEAHHLGH
jgi:serine/threonine protein kinase